MGNKSNGQIEVIDQYYKVNEDYTEVKITAKDSNGQEHILEEHKFNKGEEFKVKIEKRGETSE